MTTQVQCIVSTRPGCDICTMDFPSSEPNLADYDGKTVMGPWANMCHTHFQSVGVGLGTGRGQRLILENKIIHAKLDGVAMCSLDINPLMKIDNEPQPGVNCMDCVLKVKRGQLYRYECGCTIYYPHLIPGVDGRREYECYDICGTCHLAEVNSR